MNKYILKKIYKESQKRNTIREIKRNLKDIYNIDITSKNLKDILTNISRPNKKDIYSDRDLRRILYFYQKSRNTNLVCDFLNKKYGYNLTYSKITRIASENNVSKENKQCGSFKKVSDIEVNDIIEKYKNGLTSYEIAKIYGYKTHKSITDILEQNNIHIRTSAENGENKKSYKATNFEKIDSISKAYFIGLMITDGYVVDNHFGIDLIDKDAISYLSKEFNVKFNTIKSSKNKTKYRIIMYGEERVKQLKRFGIYNRKTFSCPGCSLEYDENKFIPYIIRGIIDGDGWIRKDGKEFFICSASENLLIWCKRQLEALGFTDLKISFQKNEYDGIYLIRSAKKENIELLKNIIYKEDFGMRRKKALLRRKTFRDYNLDSV